MERHARTRADAVPEVCRKRVRVSFITDGRQDKKPYPEKPQGIEILYNEFRRHSRYEENPKILLEAIAAGSAVIH